MRLSWSVLTVVVAGLLPVAAVAWTDESRNLGPTAPKAAQDRYLIGIQLYLETRYQDAAREFRVAQSIHPDSEKLAYNLGRALERAGSLEDAIVEYQRYLTLAPDAYDRQDVETTIATLASIVESRRPKVHVASVPSAAEVYIDDAPVALGRTPLTVHLEPGAHLVRLALKGFKPVVQAVNARLGVEGAVAANLEPLLPVGPAALADLADRPEPSTSAEREPLGSWTTSVGWSLMGGGAAGLLLGTLFLGQALNTTDEAASLGPGDTDRRHDLESEIDRQNAAYIVSYAIGGTLLAAGAVLLLWPDDTGLAVVPTGRGAAVGVRW